MIFLCMAAMGMEAATIKNLWLEMPDTILPYLTRQNRTDLVDMSDMGVKATAANLFGGKTQLDTLTDRFMALTLSGSSTLQLRLIIRAGGDSVICAVKTVSGPEKASDISVFDLRWQRLNVKIPQPHLPARPDTMSTEKYDRLMEAIHPITTYARLHADDDRITMGFSLLTASSEDRKALEALLKEEDLIL